MRGILLAIALLAAGRAEAHGGHLHWWEAGTTWTWDPWVLVPLALSGSTYALGVIRLWRRAGINRGVRAWQAGIFLSGWLLLVLALVAPLHWLGSRLFSAHMVEHEILMAVAAPLLVLGRPVVMLWAFSGQVRRAIGAAGRSRLIVASWRRLTAPAMATLLHGAALWIWHVPAFYEAALASSWIHWLQHVSFFGTAILFWRALLQGRARERGYGAAVFYLFVTSLHTGFLGILLAFMRRPIYPMQTLGAAEWGMTSLEDQQMAGLVMWIPAGLVYTGAALALAGLWIARSATLHSAEGGHVYAAR